MKKGLFNIIHDISKKVSLIQLMGIAGNFNNSVSIVGYWIFESNYKYAPPLTLDSLNLI